MALVNMPPAIGTDDDLHPTPIQLWKAATEKSWAAGNRFWPKTNWIWNQGTIASLGDNGDGTYTLVDNADGTFVPTAADRWYNYTNFSAPWLPSFYDLVFDELDESKVARAHILHSTVSGSTQTYIIDKASLQAFVDSNQIPSIASLTTRTFYIVARDGLWWSDRFPEWPNDREMSKGTATASTLTTLTDSAAQWATNEWQPGATSYELRMLTGPGIPILSNTGTQLTFAAQSVAPTGNYAIVKAGSRWRNSPGWPWKAWYRGAFILYYTHGVDDILQWTKQPLVSKNVPDGPPTCSATTTYQTLDADPVDPFVDLFNTCDTPDKCLCPDVWKTPRGLQVFMEQMCGFFVKKGVVYNAATAIAPFVPATFFKAAGINSYTTTVTALAGGGITLPAQTFPYGPIPVYYAVLDANGNVRNSGKGTATTTTHIDGAFTAPDVGCTLVLSLGWTRWWGLEVISMFYPVRYFVPGISAGALGDPPAGTVVDPPTPSTPGLWITRPVSTTYQTHSPTGFVQDGTFTFNNGDAAAYSGDNWNNPTLQNPSYPFGSDTTLAPYYDNGHIKWHDPSTHSALDKMPSGTSTGGSASQLQDTGAHWYGSVMRTETGTADSGSTVSLGDTSKATNGLWNAATGRWVGFVVRVRIAGVWHRRPITTFAGTTIGWTDPLPAPANGASYEIDEPGAGSASQVGYNLDRYGGRDLTVTDPAPGGLTYTIKIDHSDDNTLYFAPQAFVIGANWSYSISEHKPGGVWIWDAAHSKWTVPTGNDPRTGKPWRMDQTANDPTTHKDYGRHMKRDYLPKVFFDELVAGMNQLTWTWTNLNWRGELVVGTTETNLWHAADLSYNSYGSSITWFDFSWNNAPDSGTDPSLNSYSAHVGFGPGPPYAYTTCTRNGDGVTSAFSWLMEGERLYAYAVANCPAFLASVGMKCSIEYYNWGQLDALDTPTDATHAFDANGDNVRYHAWSLFDSAAESYAAERVSIAFGNPALPAPDPAADPATSPGATFAGYFIGNQIGILKWDGPNGMKML